MKKLSVLLVVMLASVSVASAQDWSAGVRLGSGFQAVGQRYFHNDNYLEGRLGMGWIYSGGLVADISVLHVWNVANMNWTDEGNWFCDLGAGVNLGFGNHYFYTGIQGMAKLGYEFDSVPLRLSLDWSPSFGPGIVTGIKGYSHSEFNTNGMANFGISAVYRF